MTTGELRIHGVSGTPPEAMLGLRAEVVDGTSRSGVQVFEAKERPEPTPSPGAG